MKKSTLSFVIAGAIAFSANSYAVTGMLTQDPNAPASAYDVIQDKAFLAAGRLANSALNQNQQIVTQVNTVSAAVGANAQAIGQTNALVGQNTQGVQQLTTQAGIQAQQTGKNAAAIAQNTQGVQQLTTQAGIQAQQTGKNAAAIGQNTQGVQQLTTQTQANAAGVANNAKNIGTVSYAVGSIYRQVGQNSAAIQQQQTVSGNFATKPEVQTAQSRADAAFKNAETNRQSLETTNKKVAAHSAELSNHESRIQTLEANRGYGTRFNALKKEVDANRRRASAGVAGVAAMANIPQVIQGQTFAVGAGVGTTDNESALAVGFSARASESVVVKASVSNDTQHNFVVGGGVSYGW